MKKITVSMLLVNLGALGCGSSSSDNGGSGNNTDAPTNFADLKTSLTTATGSMPTDSAGASAVITDFSAQSTNREEMGISFAGDNTSTQSYEANIVLQAVRPFGDSNIDCPAMQNGGQGTCQCENTDGHLTIDIPVKDTLQTDLGEKIKAGQEFDYPFTIEATNCQTDGKLVEGKIEAHFTGHSMDTITLTYEMDVTVTPTGGTAKHIKVSFLETLSDHLTWFRVKVSDGTVIVAVDKEYVRETKTGKVYVKVKGDQRWTCDLVEGKGTCTDGVGGSVTIE